jgi:peptidoglycan/LPS O-acetylase OafA/YrhL
MPDDPKKLYFLDSLRGVAILLVLLVHSGGLVELFGTKLAFANLGQRGVQLFYEVSAFSLLYSFYSRKESSWKAFFIRRFFRIAPLFYLSIIANWVWTVFILKQPPLSLAAYGAGFLFLFGFHPATINAVAPAGWSVAVESTFYVLFPLLVLAIRNLGSALFVAAVSALGCFVICYDLPVYTLTALPGEYIHFLWFPIEFPVFCFGFVAFFWWRDLFLADPDQLTFRPRLDRPALRKFASLGFLAVAGWLIYASFPVSNYRLYLNSLSFIFLILGLALHPWWLLVNPVIRFIGRMSFSIYLVHPYLSPFVSFVVDALERKYSLALYNHGLGLLVSFIAYLGGSLLISLITYPLVEARGIAFGKNLIDRLGLRPQPGPDSSRKTIMPDMESSADLSKLQAKLRMCYTLWILSLAAVIVTVFAYRKANPETADKSVAQYRGEISAYRTQVETLSAELLQNQRALKSAQKDLEQAINEVRKSQARPPG